MGKLKEIRENRKAALTICQDMEKNLEVGEGRCRIHFLPAGRDTAFSPVAAALKYPRSSIYIAPLPKPTLISS